MPPACAAKFPENKKPPVSGAVLLLLDLQGSIMNKPVSKISKVVAFVAAFLIWCVISNFIFSVLLSLRNQPSFFDWLPNTGARFLLIYYLLWFFTIITISLLYLFKRAWMAAGVLAKVLITAEIWIVILSIYSIGRLIEVFPILIVPLPSGFRLVIGD